MISLSYSSFLEVLENAIDILKDRYDPIVEIESSKIWIIGDLHGDLMTFRKIRNIIEKEYSKDDIIIFLGDYGDRGYYQVELYYELLSYFLKNSENIILIRGNHEFIEGLEVYPHDLPFHILRKFGYDKGKIVYQKIRELWEYLPFCCLVPNEFICMHGGPIVDSICIESYKNPNYHQKEQILWNDPYEGLGYAPNPRGAGYLWGRDITENNLNTLNIKYIIRGHEKCDGIKYNHNRRVITVFSTKVYGNSAGFLKYCLKENKINFIPV